MKIKARGKKRLGLGIGSGKGGHTSGRGQKGQKSRGKIGVLFEGFKVKKSFIKRLPFLRGKAKNKAGLKPAILSLSDLEVFSSGEIVDKETLVKKGLLTKKEVKNGIKILGGKLTKKLDIRLPISKSALKEVAERAGSKKS